jgi:hypothetical protein
VSVKYWEIFCLLCFGVAFPLYVITPSVMWDCRFSQSLLGIAPCSLRVHQCFRRVYCPHYQGDDGGSTRLWNVGLLWDYMALYPRRLSSSLHQFLLFLLSAVAVGECYSWVSSNDKRKFEYLCVTYCARITSYRRWISLHRSIGCSCMNLMWSVTLLVSQRKFIFRGSSSLQKHFRITSVK